MPFPSARLSPAIKPWLVSCWASVVKKNKKIKKRNRDQKEDFEKPTASSRGLRGPARCPGFLRFPVPQPDNPDCISCALPTKQLTPDEEKAVANLIVLGNRNCTRHLQRTTRLRVYVHLSSHLPRRGTGTLAATRGAGTTIWLRAELVPALFLPAGFSHQFFGLLEGGRAALTTMYTSTSSLSPSPPPQTLPFSTFLPHARSSRLPPACPPLMKGASFSPNSNYKSYFHSLAIPLYSCCSFSLPKPFATCLQTPFLPPPCNAVLFQESRAQRSAKVNARAPPNKKDQVLERKCQV